MGEPFPLVEGGVIFPERRRGVAADRAKGLAGVSAALALSFAAVVKGEARPV